LSAVSLKPVQIAYHVPDPEAAAHRLAHEFGWGPFFLLEHIKLASCLYRGRPAVFDHTSAYGQAGELMVELITQHDDTPSVLRDRFARDACGVHHLAHFVPDLPRALSELQARGIVIALDATTTGGVRFAMADVSATLGHMLELYEPGKDLLRFYAYVRRAAESWDGSDPLRRLSA
jgi:catechol 2,3-dioxygenase-like lactoylglutathione lyase family enzyme